MDVLEKYLEGKFYVDATEMRGDQEELHKLAGVHLGAYCSLLLKDDRGKESSFNLDILSLRFLTHPSRDLRE